MSFILDALRKSENERQQQGQVEFAGVPTGGRESSAPRWLWIVGILLAINLAVLLGLLMRPEAPTASRPAVQPESPQTSQPLPQTETLVESTFSDRVAAARRDLPEQRTAAPEPQSDAVTPLVITQDPDSIDASEIYPSMQEVVAAGRLSLPPLHLDIHVYSDTPAERFVFINMSKYREGERTSEGQLVEEITPDGVVLAENGISFLLTRQ